MKHVAVLTGNFFGDVQSEILPRPFGFGKEGERRRQLRLLYEGTASLVSWPFAFLYKQNLKK